MTVPAARGRGLVWLLLVGAWLALGLTACERDRGSGPSTPSAASGPAQVSSQPDEGRPEGAVRMKIGRETFTLEVAATDRARQIGLMHRRSMPQDRGMIFVFPRADDLGFWMKNTHIPLDIVYLDENGRVVSVKRMKPLDETRVESDAPAKYAIELNEGAAGRAGVKVGDMLTIPTGARDASW
jgi:uncharacterized membrane protein (UPF0127 family)